MTADLVNRSTLDHSQKIAEKITGIEPKQPKACAEKIMGSPGQDIMEWHHSRSPKC